MFFTVEARPQPVDGSHMGFRSPLVLAKLGFDLRHSYDDMIDAPLPNDITRVLWALSAREG
jgi:hypothetical protein